VTPLLAQKPRSDRAFERIYQRHVGDVYRYALVVLRNEADAEDVTQTTFLNAYRAFKGGERPRTPQNWLIAIAHNVCRQRFRQAARRPNEVAFDEELAEAVATDESPSAQDIRRALSHLAFNQRAALVMRELEGRSYTDIASILSLSVSAVETLIFRARRALREQLEGGLTCHEAEYAVSKQLDGRLERTEKGALRAHLRECEECARFARSQRAQRTAIRSLAAIPLPASLASFGGGTVATGGSVLGAGVVMKAAAVGAVAAVAGGVGYEGVKHAPWRSHARPHVVVSAKPKPNASVVKQSVQSPIQHASRLPGPGPGPSQPRGALQKPAKPSHVSVQPRVQPAADVTPGGTSRSSVHGSSSIRSLHSPVSRFRVPRLPRDFAGR
jgi:RNA polymerase sigma-70 factor, ECF subfamily